MHFYKISFEREYYEISDDKLIPNDGKILALDIDWCEVAVKNV